MSAPGNKAERLATSHDPRAAPRRVRQARGRYDGFTLIELMVVLVLVAIASSVVSLALRDPATTHLEREAARLAALLESGRAEARATGIAARWEPVIPPTADASFRFVGLSPSTERPSRWLDPSVFVEVIGARAVVLGPEPLIPPQSIVLHLNDQRLTLATDGLGPFLVTDEPEPAIVR